MALVTPIQMRALQKAASGPVRTTVNPYKAMANLKAAGGNRRELLYSMKKLREKYLGGNTRLAYRHQSTDLTKDLQPGGRLWSDTAARRIQNEASSLESDLATEESQGRYMQTPYTNPDAIPESRRGGQSSALTSMNSRRKLKRAK